VYGIELILRSIEIIDLKYRRQRLGREGRVHSLQPATRKYGTFNPLSPNSTCSLCTTTCRILIWCADVDLLRSSFLYKTFDWCWSVVDLLRISCTIACCTTNPQSIDQVEFWSHLTRVPEAMKHYGTLWGLVDGTEAAHGHKTRSFLRRFSQPINYLSWYSEGTELITTKSSIHASPKDAVTQSQQKC